VEQFGQVQFTVASPANNSFSNIAWWIKTTYFRSDQHKFTRVLAFLAGSMTVLRKISLAGAEAHYATAAYSDTVKL
jgi:hypothetical protein